MWHHFLRKEFPLCSKLVILSINSLCNTISKTKQNETPNSHCKAEKRVDNEGSAKRLEGRLLGCLTRLRHRLSVRFLCPYSLRVCLGSHFHRATKSGAEMALKFLVCSVLFLSSNKRRNWVQRNVLIFVCFLMLTEWLSIIFQYSSGSWHLIDIILWFFFHMAADSFFFFFNVGFYYRCAFWENENIFWKKGQRCYCSASLSGF